MSRPMDRKRLKQLGLTGGVAAAVLAGSVVAGVLDARQAWRPDVSGPVLAGWSETVGDTARIEIRSADDHFNLTRNGGIWVMPSRDGHPVNPARIADLDRLLGSLSYDGVRTADPAKHARLGLAEPGESGAGTRVTLSAADGTALADLVLGDMRAGRIYVRFPDNDRTYAALPGPLIQDMPDIFLADRWLDLDFIELGRSNIARTVIRPESGPTYVLERASPTSRNFALRSPAGWQPITAGAGNGPGASLSRLRFRDVRSADRLGGDIVASHSAETFEGLRVRMDIIAMGDTRWAMVSAEALSDDAEADAAALNARTQGWAYLLSDLSADRLLRPLDGIADPREG